MTGELWAGLARKARIGKSCLVCARILAFIWILAFACTACSGLGQTVGSPHSVTPELTPNSPPALTPRSIFTPIITITPSQPPPILTPTLFPIPTFIPKPAPDGVWPPFGVAHSCYICTLLTVHDEQITFEQPPIGFKMYWDYTPGTGRLAYATREYYRAGNWAVSTLWVYDYRNDTAEEWLSSDVSLAMWSPVVDPQTGHQQMAAVINHDTLLLVDGPGQTKVLDHDVYPAISWSPDGTWLAYVKNFSLYILPIEGGQAKKIADQVYYQHGWIGDRPIWAFGHRALIYAEHPFKIALMDATRSFMPLTVNGEIPQGERAKNLLWSDAHLRLALDTEDFDGDPSVWIHTLSDDLRTVVDSVSIPDARLAAWWVEGESILLDDGRIIYLTENGPSFTPLP